MGSFADYLDESSIGDPMAEALKASYKSNPGAFAEQESAFNRGDNKALRQGQTVPADIPKPASPENSKPANATPVPQFGATKGLQQNDKQRAPQYVSTLFQASRDPADASRQAQNLPGGGAISGRQLPYFEGVNQNDVKAYTTGYGITSQAPSFLGYLGLQNQNQAQRLLNAVPGAGNANTGGLYSQGEAALDATGLQRFAPGLSVSRAKDDTYDLSNAITNQLSKAYSVADVDKAAGASRAAAESQGRSNSKNQADFDRRNALLEAAKTSDTGGLAGLLGYNIKGGKASDANVAATGLNDAAATAAGNAFDSSVAAKKDARKATITGTQASLDAQAKAREDARLSGIVALQNVNTAFSNWGKGNKADMEGLAEKIQSAVRSGGLDKATAVSTLKRALGPTQVAGSWLATSELDKKKRQMLDEIMAKIDWTPPASIPTLKDAIRADEKKQADNLSFAGYLPAMY